MLKLLLPITAVILLAASANAQVSPAQMSSEALQSCLLGTGPAVWDELKLSMDQKARMTRVQEACAEECNIVGAKKAADSISKADGSTILGEVKSILSSEQYDAWVAHCAAKAPAK